MLKQLQQLEESQWWPAEQLLEYQLNQMQLLFQHAWHTSPFYRERLTVAGYMTDLTLDWTMWRRLSLLTRREIQHAGDTLHSSKVPARFGCITTVQTSGTTGEPVTVRRTEIDQLLWEALTLRDHVWHQRDFSGRLAVIRESIDPGLGAPPDGAIINNWGTPVCEVAVTGAAGVLKSSDIETQARWLIRFNPDYLLTYPTILKALAEYFAATSERLPNLRGVRTLGETVAPDLRESCRQVWGVPLHDMYSCTELGYLALQCPQNDGHYHVMAESVLVEILDEKGGSCAPGEIGRMVATSLHNFATPLIRYELGDYVEAGPPCRCGRGLPTITSIPGRTRNLLILPTGQRRWANVSFDRYPEIMMVRQHQLVQHTPQDIEARLVVDVPLTASQETLLREIILEELGYPFRLSLTYFKDEIPRGPGGKFEKFVSHIAA
ncbi:MAG TPA: AMP-binding protein [Gammaproteobacteria bacterium]|nr:AMP-binding protein [Gammaproteobacteria bacterium]